MSNRAEVQRLEVVAEPSYLGGNVADMLVLLQDFTRQYRNTYRAAHQGGGGGRGGAGVRLAWSDPTGNVALDERKERDRQRCREAAKKVNAAAIELRAAAKLIGLAEPPASGSVRVASHVLLAYDAQVRRHVRGEE